MKVALATGIYPPAIGGPATYARGLARALHARGVEVEVVTYGAVRPEAEAFPVAWVDLGQPLPVRYAAYLSAVRRVARRADVVYLMDPVSVGLPGLLASRLARRPAALKVVGDLAWEISRDLRWTRAGIEEFQRDRGGVLPAALWRTQAWVARGADAVVVPGRYLLRTVVGWGVDEGRVRVIPNGVGDLALPAVTSDEARERLGLGPGPVLTFVGRFVGHKHLDSLLGVFPRLRSRLGSAHLRLVGSGPEEEALRRQAAALGLGDAVSFPGTLGREDLGWTLRATDVFVLFSSYEGLSHVLIEALQAGLAIVASDAGGNPEVVEDGVSGVLVPTGDGERLLEALSSLLADPGRRRALGEGALRRAPEFAFSLTVERTLALLEDLARDRT